jgi:K+-transporting ATPase KdpF subunit
MRLSDGFELIIALGMLVYLTYVLIRPEKF